MGSQAPTDQRPHKILMLHGLHQSGPLFQAKTSALEKALTKAFPGIQLLYPTAPISVSADNEPARAGGRWSWWEAVEPRGELLKLDETLAFLTDLLHREGPLDGVIGFSQGAALGVMLASLLEPGRREKFAESSNTGEAGLLNLPDAVLSLEHAPLKFVVAYSGFSSEHKSCAGFYDPPVTTTSLHYMGSLDEVVDESWSDELVAHFAERKAIVLRHPGAHIVPSSKRDVAAVVDFIRRSWED